MNKTLKNIFFVFLIILSISVCAFIFTACIGNSTHLEPKSKIDVTGSLEVTFLDVGQGDCALLTCNGHNMLIDGGQPKKSDTVYTVLKNKNISYLDYIIISHIDSDHCGGIPGALKAATVGTCYCSKQTDDTKAWSNVLKRLNEQNKEIVIPEVGLEIPLGDASVAFFAPKNNMSSDNNNSIVCKVSFGNNSFLFTGDAESEEEQELLKSKYNLKTDVLKVSHHGSDKCSSKKFLKRVKPEYAIISVGKNNYGHPGEDTINRLNNIGTEVFRTDIDGDITFITDGNNLSYRLGRGD